MSPQPNALQATLRARWLLPCVLALVVGAGFLAWQKRTRPLVLVYTGHLQGCVLTTSFSAAINEVALSHRSIPRMGTVQDAATQARALVEEARHRGDHTLLLDVGSSLQGSDLLAQVAGPEPAARVMAQAGYDALACSTPEWLVGSAELARVQAASGLPFLCSNLKAPGTLHPQLERISSDRHTAVYAWYEPPHSPRLPQLQRTLKGLDFATDRASFAKTLREDGASEHLVVADVDDVDGLARSLPVACVVIPGRYSGLDDLSTTHTVGQATVTPWIDARHSLGRVTLTGRGADAQVRCEVLPLNQQPAPTPVVVEQGVEQLKKNLGPDFRTTWERFLAYSPEHLGHEVEKYLPSPAAQWVCDQMRERLRGDVALLNHKALRELVRHFVGFEGQVIYLDPFGNTLVVKALSGKDLGTLLRRNALENRRYLQISGAHLHYRKGDDKHVDILIDGEPLDESKTYRVVVNDYLAEGAHDQEPLLKGAKTLARTDICLNFVFYDHFNTTGWVVPPAQWVHQGAECHLGHETDPAQLARRGSFRQAYQAYQQHLASHPEDTTRRLALATLLLNADLPELAETTLGTPASAPALLLAARIHVALHQGDKARQELLEACKRNPQDVWAATYLGWLAFHQGDAHLARTSWEQARRLSSLIEAATLNQLLRSLKPEPASPQVR